MDIECQFLVTLPLLSDQGKLKNDKASSISLSLLNTNSNSSNCRNERVPNPATVGRRNERIITVNILFVTTLPKGKIVPMWEPQGLKRLT